MPQRCARLLLEDSAYGPTSIVFKHFFFDSRNHVLTVALQKHAKTIGPGRMCSLLPNRYILGDDVR